MSTELQVMRPQTTGLEMFDTTTMKRGDTELPLMEEYRDAVLAMRNSPALFGLFSIANAGGESVLGMLPRYTVAAAGSREWKIQNDVGDDQLSALTGVAVLATEYRIYYERTREESIEMGMGSMPSCTSPNGNVGLGNPGGMCNQCPKRSFDLFPNCRGRTRLFLIHPEERYPVLVDITGPVAQGLGQYVRNALPFGYSLGEVVSTFTLTGHPKYRSTNRSTSLIVGEPVGITLQGNEDVEYAAALQWIQETLSMACWQWSERIGDQAYYPNDGTVLVDADGVIVGK